MVIGSQPYNFVRVVATESMGNSSLPPVTGVPQDHGLPVEQILHRARNRAFIDFFPIIPRVGGGSDTIMRYDRDLELYTDGGLVGWRKSP